MHKMLLIMFLAICLCSNAFGLTAKENVDNALGQAYKAGSEKKMDVAKDWFRKAAKYAKEAGSWQGLLDSGYGLSTLNLPEEAKTVFDNAATIAKNSKDWHGTVAVGYAYASLPKKLGTTDLAINMWNTTKELAEKDGDIFGLIEAGRGFLSIQKNSEAEQCFDLAKTLLEQAPTEAATKALVEAYRKLGKEDKALECTSYQAQVQEQGPPPGWQPTAGKTVRGPKTVPTDVQMVQRESADRDIEAKVYYEQEQAALEQQERMEKQEMAYMAYRDYLMYYSYPYYGSYGGFISNDDDYYAFAWSNQPMWAERTGDEICNWSMWNLNRYGYSDGFYMCIDID